MSTLRNIFRNIAEGLLFIHSNGFSHNDIKTENVFIFEKFTVKIADFGFARIFSENTFKTP